jgi:hypothetical protein
VSDPATFQSAFAVALATSDSSTRFDPAMARALTVHRNTCAKAALDALADNYPVVRTLTGETAFGACAETFFELHAPRDSRLCFYGEDFDTFVAGYQPFADAPYLRDVARLERLRTEALFAADAVVLDGAALSTGLDMEQTIGLHPATRFERFEAPAADIWRAHQDDATPDALDQLDWRSSAALVTRPYGTVLVKRIDRAAFTFLQACAAGRPLGQAALAAAEADTEVKADIASVFSTLITAGAFALPPAPRTRP